MGETVNDTDFSMGREPGCGGAGRGRDWSPFGPVSPKLRELDDGRRRLRCGDSLL